MAETKDVLARHATGSDAGPDLLGQYGCGAITCPGHNAALYERHPLFDDVVAPAAA